MGSYTPWEFYETFGGDPDPDDHSCVGPDPREVADRARDEAQEGDEFEQADFDPRVWKPHQA